MKYFIVFKDIDRFGRSEVEEYIYNKIVEIKEENINSIEFEIDFYRLCDIDNDRFVIISICKLN